MPQSQKAVFKKEMERLVKIGVVERQLASESGSPAFIIPKADYRVRFLTNFREMKKRIVRTPFPTPQLSSTLQEMEGFTFTTTIDLNMGYYTIRLDPDAQKISTIIPLWGKYSYLPLPMGVSGAPDIFQEKRSGLMCILKYVRTYIEDLLVIMIGTARIPII